MEQPPGPLSTPLPRRALFVNHAAALGGAEFCLLMLLQHLDRSLWEPHLACAGGPLAERAAALGVPTHIAPLRRLRRSWRAPLDLASGARALARTIRHARAEVVIAFSVRAALYAAPAALLTRRPLVWYRQDLWLGERPFRWPWAERAIKRLLCAPAARIIASSHATARQQPCATKIVVVHNGIEIQRFDPSLDGAPFRERYGIPAEAVVLGIVGRLNPIKRQDAFLRVLARVLEATPQAWGLVVGGAIFGEDAYARGLLALAEELGIADRTTFTGQIAEPALALAAMDIFVQPGDPEALALANVEAMAMAKPVVGYDHGSMPEIVADGETGRLVPSGDKAALAAAALALVRDPTLRAAWGQAGRARAESRFAIERVAAEVSRELQQVLGQDALAPTPALASEP